MLFYIYISCIRDWWWITLKYMTKIFGLTVCCTIQSWTTRISFNGSPVEYAPKTERTFLTTPVQFPWHSTGQITKTFVTVHLSFSNRSVERVWVLETAVLYNYTCFGRIRQLPVVQAHCFCRIIELPCCFDEATPHIHELTVKGKGAHPCCCWSYASESAQYRHQHTSNHITNILNQC